MRRARSDALRIGGRRWKERWDGMMGNDRVLGSLLDWIAEVMLVPA